jgi:glycosyltransferase involved in cell wall biosynthesis
MNFSKNISIITINYNGAIGLEQTILSVINQTSLDFEFIVIDGGSTDESKSVIVKYQDKIDYWVSEKDNGIYHAMNKGIQTSSGEYLLFMNSGDVLVPDASTLSICQPKLIEDIVAFDCFLEKENQVVGRRTHIEPPSLFYVYKNGFKHQSTFIKSTLFQKLGLYNENYKIAGDYEFWIRCFLQPSTTAKSYTIPIAIFKLGGISQNSDWGSEHRKIEKEWLSHIVVDFQLMDQLLPYQKSRILKQVIKMQKWFKK